MESRDGIIKFEVYRHYKNMKNYRVIGFSVFQNEKGEWVDGVLYVNVLSTCGGDMYVRPLSDFKEKFISVNHTKATTIKTAIIENRNLESRNIFDGVTDNVEKYFLERYPDLKRITLDGKLLKAITSKEYMHYPEQWFDTKYMMVLEDVGDTGIPGLNSIGKASLVVVHKLKEDSVRINTIFEIDVDGYGLEFAVKVIMNAYNNLLEDHG